MKKLKGIFGGKTTKNLNTSASSSSGGAIAAPFVNGYDLKEKDLPKIHKAAWTGDLSKVKQLAKKDPTALDKENRTPLHLACAQGHADIVRELLEWKARIDIGDSQAKTPLMKAIECNQEECVRLILSHRNDVNARDRDGNSALHLAVREGNTGIVAMVISSGANVNQKNSVLQTPLILSVLEKNKKDDHTRLLLENGADPNLVDKDRRSALHHACIEDGIHHVKLLLQYNANTALKDVKGWTAEDCAMMKAHHACSQVVFDHNIKQRRPLSSSVPTTPRNPESANVSRHTTPRDESSSSGFGMPQMHQEDAEDSDDQTVSKHSLHDNRQDSWADDTDISSAADDHKLKGGAVKTSLIKHLNIESDEEEGGATEDKGGGAKAQATNGKPGDVKRPMYSRSPTPDADVRNSPGAPYNASTPSKIPVKQRLSGASHTSIEDDFTDDEDDSSPIQRNRVSFSDHQQVRNISATDDDTDIDDDDEEEVEPTKKRRIETPEEASGGVGYLPTGAVSAEKKYSKDTYRAENGGNEMMKDLGMEDMSDVSDVELDDSEARTPRGSSIPNSQQNTPKGILKKSDTPGNPPAVQNAVDTDPFWDSDEDDLPNQEREIIVEAEVYPAAVLDSRETSPDKDEESDWDSTRHSGTDRGNQSIQIREEAMSPEIDSDLEDTLNPERSAVEKTSQWDSSEEAYTPRTPRDGDGFGNQARSPEIQEFDYEDEEEESLKQDKIQEAVTSFGVRHQIAPSPGMQSLSSGVQSQPTPEPQSDSSQLRSRDTPDPPTTTTSSASMQKTVITAHVVEPEESPRQQDDDDDDDDWDSEDDVQSEEEEDNVEEAPPVVGVSSPVVLGIDSANNTPRTPRGQASSATDEESVSEWEVERQQEREERDKREHEMQLLQEIEEEEERQRQWEEEERRRQAEIEREAQAELEREKHTAEEEDSDVSDFSDNVLPDSARQHDSDYSQPSQHASQKSQQSEVSERSQMSDNSHPNNLTSPRMLGEIENESPAPAYDDLIEPQHEHHRFAAPTVQSQDQGQMKDIYGDREEDESDEDIEEINDEQAESPVQFESKEQTYTSKTDPFEGIVSEYTSGEQFGANQQFVAEVNGGVEDQSDEEEFDEGVQEDMILPQGLKQTETMNTQPSRAELPPSVNISSSNAGRLLNEPPPLPKSAPPGKAMSLQSDGQSVEDDDLDIPVQTKPPGPSLLPDLSGTTGLYTTGLEVPFDDDGLSITSTENGDISSSYRPDNLPYGKDMLVNMNLNDSSAVLKLQEHLREHRKQLEYERSQKMLLESKQKQMSKDKTEMQKMVDSLKYQKSALEQAKLDLEAKIRNLEYCVNDEEEKKKNAELLLKKTKEQLTKKEEQYTHEMEGKQRAELAMRNVQMDLRSVQNQMKDLEEEKAELERQLANEKNARQLQEKINEEQQRLQQHIQEESLKTSSQKDEANRSLELADDDIKYAKDLVDKYKNEITALKAELQRQRTRLTEENSLLSSENEKLQQRIDDLRNELKDHEEALTQLTVQQNLHSSKLVSESTMLSNSLEKERISREKLEAELESIRTRLQSSTVQLEKSQQARNDADRRLHDEREEWARQLDRKDQELTSLKDKVQAHIHALNSTETKLNAVENELQISNTTLLERTNQYQQTQRDLQYYKTAQDNYDSNYRHEKELNAKHIAKIESLQERLSGFQHENLSLKQQVDTAQHMATDRAGFDLQDKLNTMIAGLKADHDKARASLEEKNTNLQDTITRLREDVRNSENRRSNLEQDIRRLNQEQNDIVRKLSIAEASLDVASKARDQLEQERLALKMEIEKLQQRYNTAQETTIQAQTRMGDLVDRLDRTEQSRLLSTQQLADTSATMQAFNTSKSELEENYQKLQVDNVRLDAELKHEKQKTDMIQRDLADSQKVRSSLEALCSNLKSTNAHLEEKLGPEQLREVTASIAQLERHKQETSTHLEEEKRKTRKALEQKKVAETKLEAEQDKCQNLQKEVANLKAYLKVAKKRLKEPGSDEVQDSNENRMSNLHSAFDQERHAMEEMLVSVKTQNSVETGYTEKSTVDEAKKDIEARYRQELNRKLDEVNNYLEEQARTRQRLDTSREEQDSKLRTDKKKFEDECIDLRIKYEQSAAKLETKEMEAKRYRDLYESEMQWRMRLSEQLYRSTDKAFDFKNNAERQKNRMHGSLTNLSMNGHTLDLSRVNGSLSEDALSNRLRAELDRSIAKHLEAAPHDQMRPLIRGDDPVLGSNFAKASADYIELLKRKYCV